MQLSRNFRQTYSYCSSFRGEYQQLLQDTSCKTMVVYPSGKFSLWLFGIRPTSESRKRGSIAKVTYFPEACTIKFRRQAEYFYIFKFSYIFFTVKFLHSGSTHSNFPYQISTFAGRVEICSKHERIHNNPKVNCLRKWVRIWIGKVSPIAVSVIYFENRAIELSY
jgi:hypothetical protein